MIRLVIILTSFSLFFRLAIGARTGPYKATYLRVENCSKPSLPIDRHPPASINLELSDVSRKVRLVKGRFIIYRDYQPKQIKSTSYMWHNGKWKVNYVMRNMVCNRLIFTIIAVGTGMRYDHKTCNFLKGDYSFNNFSLDHLTHKLLGQLEYGRNMWRSEVFSDAGSFYCVENESIVEPITHK